MIHPSALLRLKDEEEKHAGYASFVTELRSIERFVDRSRDQTNSGICVAEERLALSSR
jgi:hypothetical protein